MRRLKEEILKEKKWTESVAVGSKSFVEDIKTKLGPRGKYRPISEENGTWEIRVG